MPALRLPPTAKLCLTLCCRYMKNSAARKTKTDYLKNSTAQNSMASTYLNCPNSHAANVIMIEIPDRLAAFFKQNRDEARTTTACDLKLDPSERGPLPDIAGYIVSKLYHAKI